MLDLNTAQSMVDTYNCASDCYDLETTTGIDEDVAYGTSLSYTVQETADIVCLENQSLDGSSQICADETPFYIVTSSGSDYVTEFGIGGVLGMGPQSTFVSDLVSQDQIAESQFLLQIESDGLSGVIEFDFDPLSGTTAVIQASTDTTERW